MSEAHAIELYRTRDWRAHDKWTRDCAAPPMPPQFTPGKLWIDLPEADKAHYRRLAAD